MSFYRPTLWFFAALIIASGAYWLYGAATKSHKSDDRGPQATLVTTIPITTREFVDLVESVGTAKANESVDLTAKATETIGSISFEDGQKVPKGYILAELTNREQTADLNAARASLNELERALSRSKELAAKGYVTGANLDAAKAARDSAAARVTATQSRITDRTIRAPFAGVLGLRKVSVGTLVRPGDLITTLDDISKIKVDFTVPEAQLSAIKKGGSVRAIVAAFPERKFSGTIESIDTRIDPVSRTISVRAIIPNTDGALMPGMLMTMGIESNKRTALAVPEQSLVPIESKQYVFIVAADKTVERREVKTGTREPGFVEILSGARIKENVVVDGTLRLRPGATVKFADDKPNSERGRKKPK